MAEVSYPQIPATVWWGIRDLLKKTPSARFDESMISAKLGVQPAASRQYLAELRRVGILDEEGKASEVAGRWRMDDSYVSSVSELVSGAYPESLVTIAPPGDADRNTVVNWFMSQGLGEGSAKNKTATYLLISSLEPSEPGATGQPKAKEREAAPKPTRKAKAEGVSKKRPVQGSGNEPDVMPININVQIHISADSSSEQIDSIFKSMKEHLYGG